LRLLLPRLHRDEKPFANSLPKALAVGGLIKSNMKIGGMNGVAFGKARDGPMKWPQVDPWREFGPKGDRFAES